MEGGGAQRPTKNVQGQTEHQRQQQQQDQDLEPQGNPEGAHQQRPHGGRGQQPRAAGPKEEKATLNVVYLNARSIVSKLSDLKVFVDQNEPDILLISESWANEQLQNSMLSLDGYNLETELRKDRQDTLNGIGGGLLVYSKQGLKIIPNSNQNNFNQFCSFKIKGQKEEDDINITLIYRPPSSNQENVEHLCDLISSAPDNTLIIGDFNFPGIDWTNYTAKDAKSRLFLETIEEHEFNQLIDFPTHIKGNILDLALTNFPEKVLDISCLGNLANSDHSILSFDILTKLDFCEPDEERPDWKRCDFDGLANFFDTICWQDYLGENDTETSWSMFKEKIDEGIEKFVPMVKKRNTKGPKWFNRKLLKLTRKKERLWKEYIKFGDLEKFSQYKKSEKECKKAIRKAKRDFEKKIANDNNLKTFNAYIKKKTKNKTSVGPILKDKKIITENAEIANILNDYFCSVFSKDEIKNSPNLQPMKVNRKLEKVVFTPRTVEDKIKTLKSSSACGPDRISTIFLQQFKVSLALPLSIIFNKSMETGYVPRDWRDANVTPIFKTGVKGNPANYRPISLTSVPCKIMESLIKDEVMEHLLLNQLIRNSQHGFVKNKSCVTNLLEFFETVSWNLDNSNSVDVIYLDFSKAFDKVPRRELIKKLQAHGLENNLLNWMNSWLSDRRQRVVLLGAISPWCKVTSGVPQGSVLGPLAFIIYINDLDLKTLDLTVRNKFADDTKLGHVVNSLQDSSTLQNCLDQLCQWAKDWGMMFNEKKCKVVHFGRNNQRFNYSMNGVNLEKSDCERDLGVLMCSTMKPSKQCEEAARKAKAMLGMMTRAFHYRDRNVFLKLYKQYIRCHLEYAVSVWCPWTETDSNMLEKVQIKAVNSISGLSGKSYSEKLKELNLQSLSDRRTRFDMIQVYKIIKGYDHVDRTHMLQLVDISIPKLNQVKQFPPKPSFTENTLSKQTTLLQYQSNRSLEQPTK